MYGVCITFLKKYFIQTKTSGGGDVVIIVVVYILRQSGTVLCYCLSYPPGLTVKTS